ncbi:methionyl aminopeptidase [Spinactinospora alkalitolerans]|uniref:Methionine aminopeptidase n=1 Tax=Spinactinospora alkalitolerans TaxID=687207 RepID=A0A852TU45_9ACTN|nr:type I methionyl aminopeptidase [Spinactinospora alkalitolerans]NYE47458.1 methionyl aminopeptidase [Spinactinospora alkalitolerans]
MVELKTPAEIEAMRAAGRIVARALDAVRAHAAAGVRVRELDEVAAKVIADAGAEPLFLGHHPSGAPAPFPDTVCASLNDAVAHGVPTDERIEDGDVVSIDCGARLRGWCADAATTFIAGAADPADAAMIAATDRALRAGIEAARPGRTIGDVSEAIGGAARGAGYGMLADHGGHGIGRVMHEAPHVPNEGRGGRGMRLRPGLVLALEPMLTRGGDAYRIAPDGWTVRTADGSRAAHSEHTVAITADGPLVLTAP